MSFTVPSTTTQPSDVSSSPFWPSLNTGIARDVLRLDGTVTDARLLHALVYAISAINSDLFNWRNAQLASGHSTLAAVPADPITIDGETESQKVMLYRRAVFAITKALLMERTRSYDTTGDGHDAALQLAPAIDECYRDAHWCVREIQGQPRTTVELI